MSNTARHVGQLSPARGRLSDEFWMGTKRFRSFPAFIPRLVFYSSVGRPDAIDGETDKSRERRPVRPSAATWCVMSYSRTRWWRARVFGPTRRARAVKARSADGSTGTGPAGTREPDSGRCSGPCVVHVRSLGRRMRRARTRPCKCTRKTRGRGAQKKGPHKTNAVVRSSLVRNGPTTTNAGRDACVRACARAGDATSRASHKSRLLDASRPVSASARAEWAGGGKGWEEKDCPEIFVF